MNPLRPVDQALRRASGRMTPGQRWTAALALLFGTCLVLLGLPVRTTVVPGQAAAAAAAPAPSPPGTAPVPTPPTTPATAAGTAPPPIATLLPAPATDTTPAPATTLPPLGEPATAAPAVPPRVVVLTAGNPSGLPNRDDAAIAAAFFSGARYTWSAVDVSGDPGQACAAAMQKGDVAVASHSLDPALRRCLLAGGVTILAFDEAGTGGGLFSTRRGDAASLADLARWGLAARTLDGRVGLVFDAARRADLQPAVAQLRSAGLRVVATEWATTDSTTYAAEVSDLQRAGAEDVVFAAPVQTQGGWVQVATALRAPFHYVVSDVDDGVVNETYPAPFDGALAYTSLRVPWYARSHGATAQQQQCTAKWTAAATPPTMLQSEEETVYAWCEEAAALGAGALDPASLARVTISSPLTSDVGPLAGGGWGPTADATLVWRATCSCWQEQRPFGPRP